MLTDRVLTNAGIQTVSASRRVVKIEPVDPTSHACDVSRPEDCLGIDHLVGWVDWTDCRASAGALNTLPSRQETANVVIVRHGIDDRRSMRH